MVDRTSGHEVIEKRLTYLGIEKIESLYDCIDGVETAAVPGDFLEFGIALGGSGICLARALGKGRRYLGFDVFGMIPPPSGKDGQKVLDRYKMIEAGQSTGINGDPYYGYIDNLFEVVKSNFSSFGCVVDGETIQLVKGLFSDTLPLHSNVTIAIAHIDCDWYEPVLYCLNYVWPRLAAGGFIILDDYNAWEGCKTAVNEFLAANKMAVLVRTEPHAIIRKSL